MKIYLKLSLALVLLSSSFVHGAGINPSRVSVQSSAAAPIACRLSDGASFYTASGGGSSSGVIVDGVNSAIKATVNSSNELTTHDAQLASILTQITGIRSEEARSGAQNDLYNLLTSLATNYSTSAKQDLLLAQVTGIRGEQSRNDALLLNNTSVASIDSKTPALGQTTKTGSVPVVLASDQGNLGVSGTLTANQGTSNSVGNAWATRITDLTNTAVVKPGSTAPLGTDSALVVSVSPNSANQSVTVLNPTNTVTSNQGTSNSVGNAWATRITDLTNTAAVKPGSTAPVGTDSALVVSVSPNSANQSVTVLNPTNTVTSNQGTSNSIGNAWATRLTDLTNTAVIKPGSTSPLGTDPALVVSLSPNSANPSVTVLNPTTTVTSNIGTTNGIALDATLTGGTQKTLLRGSAKGTTSAGDLTSTNVDANTQALDTAVKNFPTSFGSSQVGTWTVQPGNTANTTPWLVTFTQPALVAGSAIIGKVGIDQTTPGTTNLVSIGTSGTVGLNAMAAANNNPTGVVSVGNTLGKANVIKTGTLTTTATTADQVVLTYTVTTGKTFYLMGGMMYGKLTTVSATAIALGAISLETPSGTKVDTENLMNMTTGQADRVPLPQIAEPIPVASATVIRVVVTPGAVTSTLWGASIWGYEK